jgi:tripeptide aminopeptidase
MTADSLLDRFLRYVLVDTQSDEKSSTYPSTPGQLVLGRMLCEELKGMGLVDAKQSEFGIVIASIPATIPGAPTVAFIAHVDTSPETAGKNVDPQVVRNYPGGDVVLPKDSTKVIRAADNPELIALVGKTLITTDGTTLLGADDKAGVAVIMEFTQRLLSRKDIHHGKVVVCFTCDEEIGKGVHHLEPADLGADVAYTLDGQGAGEIEAETFSADKATVTITGVNIHPSIAKGRMVNAIRLVGLFLDRMPQRTLSPESTDGRDGFLHPYQIEGGVGEAKIHILLRDFETTKLAEEADLLREIGRSVEREYPAAKIAVDVKPQYRNMRDGIAREPRAVPYAVEAVKRAGLEPKLLSIRGGTDGALLTAKGLPTPNLSCGEHTPHSPLEWTCLEEMEAAVRTLEHLVQVWAGR